MKERFARLIDVKSIVTLAMTAAFIYLAVTSNLSPDNPLTQVYFILVSFYFGTQYQKMADTVKDANER